ncbi:MAG: hypothetical protein F4028_11035 [Acidimicrobiaceae bacterium]|nr:hypothetical protein [Acidimicrobiaceae bacterium]MYG55887.1 hypothetical protein [Acidimicrobiaceae bacterium]MYI59142.1 hypothetical protein [Acidimicrobiaceae bacterium]MYJ99510.1 hypothetical protein [Acidimicrobiaceae bacterium]
MSFHVISISMAGITVTRRNGNLLACKTARPEDSDRIRHEAQLLRRLEHPGVVQFVDFVEGHPVELYLAFVGPDSWATQPPNTPAESLEALASAASIVADLHDLGTVHGALCPEHVLVAPDKRPVLCGLADAAASSEAGCARDLAGFAGLIDHLAAACEEKERRQLEALARRAERGSVTASDLTAELDRMHGGPHRRAARHGRTAPPVPSRRVSAAAIAVIGLAVLGWLLFKPGGSTDTTLALSAVQADPVPVDPVPVDPVPTSTNPAAVLSPDTTELAESRSGAVNEDPLIITHQGRRYGVGQLGDVAILGDWTCDGEVTMALLQPSTGLVAVFATWPAPSERLEADYVTVIEGAVDLRNDPIDGCDHLRVIHAGGSTLIDSESL